METVEKVFSELSQYIRHNTYNNIPDEQTLKNVYINTMSQVHKSSFLLRSFIHRKYMDMGVSKIHPSRFTSLEKIELTKSLVPAVFDYLSLYDNVDTVLNTLRSFVPFDNHVFNDTSDLHYIIDTIIRHCRTPANDRIIPVFHSEKYFKSVYIDRAEDDELGFDTESQVDDFDEEIESLTRVSLFVTEDEYDNSKLINSMLTDDEKKAIELGFIAFPANIDNIKVSNKSPLEAKIYKVSNLFTLTRIINYHTVYNGYIIPYSLSEVMSRLTKDINRIFKAELSSSDIWTEMYNKYANKDNQKKNNFRFDINLYGSEYQPGGAVYTNENLSIGALEHAYTIGLYSSSFNKRIYKSIRDTSECILTTIPILRNGVMKWINALCYVSADPPTVRFGSVNYTKRKVLDMFEHTAIRINKNNIAYSMSFVYDLLKTIMDCYVEGRGNNWRIIHRGRDLDVTDMITVITFKAEELQVFLGLLIQKYPEYMFDIIYGKDIDSEIPPMPVYAHLYDGNIIYNQYQEAIVYPSIEYICNKIIWTPDKLKELAGIIVDKGSSGLEKTLSGIDGIQDYIKTYRSFKANILP